MNLDALKAALLAVLTQAGALGVGYGVVDNSRAAQWIALSVAIINAAALIAHPLHKLAPAKDPELPVINPLTVAPAVVPAPVAPAPPTPPAA